MTFIKSLFLKCYRPLYCWAWWHLLFLHVSTRWMTVNSELLVLSAVGTCRVFKICRKHLCISELPRILLWKYQRETESPTLMLYLCGPAVVCCSSDSVWEIHRLRPKQGESQGERRDKHRHWAAEETWTDVDRRGQTDTGQSCGSGAEHRAAGQVI